MTTGITYTIKAGDTLNKIAQQFGTTAAALGQANKIMDINKIAAGANLNIPTPLVQPTKSNPFATTPSPLISNVKNAGTVTPPAPVNKANATQFGASPVNTPPPVNNTNYQSKLATTGASAVEAATDETKAYADAQAKNADGTPNLNTKEGLLASLIDKMTKLGTKGDRTLELQGQYDVAGKTEALNKINNKILQTDRAYEKRKRAMEKNPEGKLEQGLNIDLSNLDKQRNEDMADLAIVKAVAIGDLDTANQIVEAKVAAEFEPIQNEIDTLKTIYTLNLNNLSDSEKIALEEQISNREAERDYQYEIRLAQEKAKLDATTGGGDGTVSPEAQGWVDLINQGKATIANVPQKLKTEVANALTASSTSMVPQGQEAAYANVAPQSVLLVNLVKQYKDFLASHSAINLSAANKATKNNLISQITAEYKNAKKLGTLDAGVQKLIEGLLGSGGLAKLSFKSQSKAVDNFLSSLGYNGGAADPLGISSGGATNNPLGI